MKQYILAGMDQALIYMQMANIPNIVFDIDLGITVIQFSLKDIKITMMDFGDVDLKLYGDHDYINAGLHNMQLEI